MGDIATKLAYLNETKSLIKQAIIDKGVDIQDSDTFRSYADKIAEITSGETISSVTPLGLKYWLDAIENTGGFGERLSGNDYSGNYAYWYNLVGNNRCTVTRSTTTSKVDWTNDYVTLNDTIRGYNIGNLYTYTNAVSSDNKDLTMELVFSVNKYNTTNASHLINNFESGGDAIRIDSTGDLLGATHIGSSTATYVTTSSYKVPLYEKIYCCFRKKEGMLTFFSNISNTIDTTELTDVLYKNLNVNYALGYNPKSDGSYQSSSQGQSYINVHSLRMYTRYISDEEMMGNYKYDKNRYNLPTFYKLTINPSVDTATVTLTADGYIQEDSVNCIYVAEGTEVTYSVSADGYTTQTGTITVNDTQTIDVSLTADLISGGAGGGMDVGGDEGF